MDEFEELDDILRSRAAGYLHSISMDDSSVYKQAVNRGLAYGLLVRRGYSLDLLERGYEVMDAGGFLAWQGKQNLRADELHRAALETAKATVMGADAAVVSANASVISSNAAVDSARYARQSRNSSYVARGIAGLALVVATYSVWLDSQATSNAGKQPVAAKAVDSLALSRSPAPTPKAAPPQSQRMK